MEEKDKEEKNVKIRERKQHKEQKIGKQRVFLMNLFKKIKVFEKVISMLKTIFN